MYATRNWSRKTILDSEDWICLREHNVYRFANIFYCQSVNSRFDTRHGLCNLSNVVSISKNLFLVVVAVI